MRQPTTYFASQISRNVQNKVVSHIVLYKINEKHKCCDRQYTTTRVNFLTSQRYIQKHMILLQIFICFALSLSVLGKRTTLENKSDRQTNLKRVICRYLNPNIYFNVNYQIHASRTNFFFIKKIPKAEAMNAERKKSLFHFSKGLNPSPNLAIVGLCNTRLLLSFLNIHF